VLPTVQPFSRPGLCGAHLGQIWCRVGRRWYRSGPAGLIDLLDDDLSSAMGTETLLAHNLVPDGLPTPLVRPLLDSRYTILEGQDTW
jgi:hypothetical protein